MREKGRRGRRTEGGGEEVGDGWREGENGQNKGESERCNGCVCVHSENEALWREIASLRQKHSQQQKVVNKVQHPLSHCQ